METKFKAGDKVYTMIDNKITLVKIDTADYLPDHAASVYRLKGRRFNSTKCYFDEDLFLTAVSLAANLLNNIKEK